MAENNDINLSVVQHGVNNLKIEHTPFPDKPGPDEVTLETHTVGICGSDVHILIHGKGSGPTVLDAPMICGHESSAVVVEVGENVKHLKKGDRVAIEPAVPCFKCQMCKEGSYNVCPEIVCQAAPPYDGCLRRFYNHNAAFCHKIPDNMSFGEGALIEPLAVAVYACQRAGIAADMQPKVLVTGAGPIGILCALTAKALGALDVCIIDINKSRLDFANRVGIQKTVLVSKLDDERTIANSIVRVLESQPNITIECTGVELCVNASIEATRDGGSIVMVGFNPKKINVALTKASDREITLVGTKRYRNSFPLAISLVSSGKIDVKPLITHVFDMRKAVEAFDTAKSCADGVIKVQIECKN